MKPRAACFSVIASVASVLLGSPLALATSHPHNGTFCQSNSTGIVYGSQFGVHNMNGFATEVICPIQRDQGQTNNIVRLVKMTVFDRHPGVEVFCTVRGMTRDGTLVFQMSGNTVGFSSGAMPPIEFFPNVALGHEHTLTLTCSLPPIHGNGVSHLASYLVIEE